MTESHISRETLGYNGIYLERSGKSARALAEKLVAPPELPLDNEQADDVHCFEASLLGQEIRNGVTVVDAIRNHMSEETTAPLFFSKAFLDGTIDVSVVDSEAHFDTSRDVYTWLARSIQMGSLTPVALRKLAKQSHEIYTEAMAGALSTHQELSPEEYDSMPLVVNPDQFSQAVLDNQAARKAMLVARQEYADDTGDPARGAKRAVTEIYLGKINACLAEDIPVADYLKQQARLIADSELEMAATDLIPTGLRPALETPDMRERIFRRLDYLRNGMGISETGKASAVTHELRSITTEGVEEGRFNAVEIRKLKSFMLSPDTMRGIFTNILQRADLLSAEPSETWTPERKGRAADNLFQVVENPGKTTFAVNGPSGAYKVPSKARSLYDALVIGGAHELTHIDQAQANRALGEQVQAASVGGRRVSLFREANANLKQREAEADLFGSSKPIAMTYARALQALEKGGDIMDAAKAFYSEKLSIDPGIPPINAAEEAADRVIRLIRRGGRNSQPMVYGEEAIIQDELSGVDRMVRERAMAITSLDLVDQVRLHKYGLLPQVEVSSFDWTSLVLDELEPYIQQALHGDNNHNS